MRRSWIRPRNAIRVRSFFLAIVLFSSASLYFSGWYSGVRTTDVGGDDFRADVNELCHSDPDISFRAYPTGSVSSENCYESGFSFENRTSVKPRHIPGSHAIELPSLSSSVLRRCRENPYHAFYDCLWPLIHYISTCVPLKSADMYTLVVSNDPSGLRFVNDGSWLEGALASIIQGLSQYQLNINIGIQKLPTTPNSLLCFSSVVRFRPDANWRPLRYKARFSANTSVPHPERIKAAGLKLFRKLAISSVNSEISQDTAISVAKDDNDRKRVIVYDRGDARRRRWTNGFDFAWKLNTTLGDLYDVVYLWKMPRTFREQVEVHAGAVALIAPHGASFANSLFMPTNAVLLEIASRNCNDTETSVEMEIDEKREDGWTVWHAAKLDMNYVAVGCRIAKERGMAIKTDNEALLKITTALLRVREESLGLGIDD